MNTKLVLTVLFSFGCVVSVRAEVVQSDIFVFGGTSGGVSAAVQAARMGKSVVLAEPGRHLGGMTAGGLSAVDIGDPRSVGGIAREYFTRLAATVGTKLAWDREFESVAGGPATGGAYAIEPHKAERLFNDMVREAGVKVHFGARLASVKKLGARISEFVTEGGTVFRAKMFIDATYEGDLMAKAGVSYTLLREGNAKYGETYNGIHYSEKYHPRTNHLKPGPSGRVPGGQGVWDRDFPLDPYVIKGDSKSGLLPLIQEGDPGKPGEPAPGVQAYCYRLCLTTNPANRFPIAPPPDYDPKRYEIVARFIEACLAIGDDMDLRWFSKHDPLPNDKWDFNTATFGGNLPGASHAWPEASYAGRDKIARQHENYHRGLLHFLGTDYRVPEKVRKDMQRFGLPKDEFADNGGWPHQIYVREARRMVSDLVMTEHHTFGRQTAPQSIALGSYGTDIHEIRRIVKGGVVIREGKIATGRDDAPPYAVGYGAIVPKAAECENLLVTFALSASHTAFASIRMEPVFMVTSQSAATAAAMAIDDKVPVQQLDYARLRARLLADKQVVEWKGEQKTQPKKQTAQAAQGEDRNRAAAPGYLALMRAHYDRVIASGMDVYGADQSGLWLASVDTNKGGQPDKPDPKVKRTYRQIHAPRGSNLYWDQPYIVAAHNLSRLTGDPRYRAAADRYVRDFLARCVSQENGLFLWGNHFYYDVFTDKIVSFSGSHHEARPLPCAWQLFWNIGPDKTEHCIRSIGAQHVKDAGTGLFCRHASTEATKPPPGEDDSTHPFLEAGGVIVESLSWLYAQTGRKDEALKERALRVARFSFSHGGEKTGLLRNQPGPEKRWDYYAATTEIGLWAGCLLRSGELTGAEEFRTMARDAVAAYLRYGYDAASGRFYGQLSVSNGAPRKPERTASAGEATIYQPGEFADLWEPLFPTHNYPMCLAEACLTLYQQTHDDQFKQAVQRFAKLIALSTPANGGEGAYADQYGRCIHFLARAANLLNAPEYLAQARRLADEAIGHFYSTPAGMFRSHPGEDRCDAVDGMGIFFLSLLYLETGKEPELMGFGW